MLEQSCPESANRDDGNDFKRLITYFLTRIILNSLFCWEDLSDLNTHGHGLNGPAVLLAEYADGLLQCFFTLFHVRLFLLAVSLLLFNSRTLTQRR